MHYVINGQCGAMLTKKFVETMYKIKLSYLDNLVQLTNDYDLWILNNPNSKHMNDIMFYKYHPKKFREVFFSGRTEFNDEELAWIEERKIKFEKLYDELEIYELDRIRGCVINAREFINEIAHRLMEEEQYSIVFIRNPSSERISIRHNIDNLDMGGILKNHEWGGGHRQSAGCFSKGLTDFNEKLKILEEEIYQLIRSCE
jgi:oligoribonuclease NrnB/cAMP/cGMP phosphodiesterase (DHH superfamily)